jgi:hypothetical protein
VRAAVRRILSNRLAAGILFNRLDCRACKVPVFVPWILPFTLDSA